MIIEYGSTVASIVSVKRRTEIEFFLPLLQINLHLESRNKNRSEHNKDISLRILDKWKNCNEIPIPRKVTCAIKTILLHYSIFRNRSGICKIRVQRVKLMVYGRLFTSIFNRKSVRATCSDELHFGNRKQMHRMSAQCRVNGDKYQRLQKVTILHGKINGKCRRKFLAKSIHVKIQLNHLHLTAVKGYNFHIFLNKTNGKKILFHIFILFSHNFFPLFANASL